MSETEVRSLRAKVFFRDCSDGEWANVGFKWMIPENIEWLLAHQGWPFPPMDDGFSMGR